MARKIGLLQLGNYKPKRVGLRLVLILFVTTFLSNLPTGQLPTWLDLYKAVLVAAIGALLLLERGEAPGPK